MILRFVDFIDLFKQNARYFRVSIDIENFSAKIYANKKFLQKKTFFTSSETLHNLRDHYCNNDSISYCKFKYNFVSTEL